MENRIHSICMLLMRLGRMRHRIIDGRIQSLGIHPSQHFILMQLHKAGRGVSQAKLAEEINVSPALVARTLKNLESGGYIQRADSRADGRCNETAVTEKGAQVLQEGLEIFREIDTGSFEGFSGEELAQFNHYLERMRDNLLRLEKSNQKEMNPN